MQLSIVIVSYNTATLTLQTIQSIYRSLLPHSPLRQNFEIIVVDNDSRDDTLAQLRALKRSNLKLIASKQNLGFGRGNNLGFKSATGQYILFLNSDTIVQPGSLEKMVAYYQDCRRALPLGNVGRLRRCRPLGLLAAQLLNPDHSPQPQGGYLPSLLSICATMYFLDDLPLIGRFLPAVQQTGRRFRAKKACRRDFLPRGWVGGTAVLIYRDYLEDFATWDPEIFMYGEDQELAYRLHRAGFRHGILTTAPIVHLGSASSSSRSAILGEIKGYFYFFRKHRPRERAVYLKALLYYAMILRVFIFTFLKKDPARAKVYAEALDLIARQEV